MSLALPALFRLLLSRHTPSPTQSCTHQSQPRTALEHETSSSTPPGLPPAAPAHSRVLSVQSHFPRAPGVPWSLHPSLHRLLRSAHTRNHRDKLPTRSPPINHACPMFSPQSPP